MVSWRADVLGVCVVLCCVVLCCVPAAPGGFGGFGAAAANPAAAAPAPGGFGGFGAAAANPAAAAAQRAVPVAVSNPLILQQALANPYGVDFAKPVTVAQVKEGESPPASAETFALRKDPKKTLKRSNAHSLRNATLASVLLQQVTNVVTDGPATWEAKNLKHPAGSPLAQIQSKNSITLLSTPISVATDLPTASPFRTPAARPRFAARPVGEESTLRIGRGGRSTPQAEGRAGDAKATAALRFSEGSQYVSTPTLAELNSMPASQLSSVQGFSLRIPGKASVSFLDPVDLTSVEHPLDRVVALDPEDFTADFYPERDFPTASSRPLPGEGLNVRVEVCFEALPSDITEADLEVCREVVQGADTTPTPTLFTFTYTHPII